MFLLIEMIIIALKNLTKNRFL